MSFSKAFTVEGEEVYFSNPAALSEDEWKTLWKESEKIGYCFRNVQEYRAYYTELNDELSSKGEKPLALRNDQKDSIARYIGIPTSNNEFMEKAATYIKEAEEYYGSTDVYSYVGYITPNGVWLNFNDSPKYSDCRTLDHRDVIQIIPAETQNDALIQFLAIGNIRCMEQGIDIMRRPTKVQRKSLMRFIREVLRNEGHVTVDFSGNNGHVYENREYDRMTSAADIVEDIEKVLDERK